MRGPPRPGPVRPRDRGPPAARPRTRGSRARSGRTMPRCSEDSSIPQPTANPTTAPSCSTTNVVKAGSSKSASMSATEASTVGGVCIENTGERPGARERDVDAPQRRDVAALGEPERQAGRDRERLARVRRLADRVDVLLPEPDAEPGVHELRVGRGHDRVVAGGALVHPAARGEPVQIADRLGLDHRVTGPLDPAVRSPHRRARRTQQIAHELVAAMRDGPGRPVDRRDRRDLAPGGGGVLVGRGQARLRQPLDAVAGGQQPARAVERVGRERADDEAVGARHDPLMVRSGSPLTRPRSASMLNPSRPAPALRQRFRAHHRPAPSFTRR